jgi:metal-responsive CopG/Arc/MetJ family transcriptional regulator
MPDEYTKKMNMLSKKMGLRRSDIVRLALKKFLEENEESDQRTPFQKAGHLLGAVESGIRDLGLRHRQYLIKEIRKGA